jgi:3-dehydroquinate dehydratase-2
MRALVLNGPNLNLLGIRDPSVYGDTTLAELEERCRAWGREHGCQIDTAQSNHEGVLIDLLHDAIGRYDAIVINPGALTHYSYALRDAIEAIGLPTAEVHISDISAREEWRARSVISDVCAVTVAGEGVDGYRQAIVALTER